MPEGGVPEGGDGGSLVASARFWLAAPSVWAGGVPEGGVPDGGVPDGGPPD